MEYAISRFTLCMYAHSRRQGGPMSNTTAVTEISNLADLEIDQLEELANALPDDWSRNLTHGIIDVLADERKRNVTDPLTGLGNLRRFNGYLKLLEKHHSEEVVAVLILDLDHFKKINDTYGHDGGQGS